MPSLSVFSTDLGWFGLVGAGRTVRRLLIGHASADAVRTALHDGNGFSVEDDWQPELRRRLEQFARGERIDFADCAVEESPFTPFQRRILAAVRALNYGETAAYGEVARRAGAPRAARAVGNVMRGNAVPIIIPCHRVIAAGGRLGGFSAPQGTALKRRLLEMEAAVLRESTSRRQA
ncbi:MAG: methylated-DNA--[protein]-cysteine S-methyltransferase [Planctomycetaceae bacterium]